MARKKLGVGAVCRCPVKYLHPQKDVQEKVIKATRQTKVSGLIVLRQEIKRVNRRQQMCVVFRHNDWPDQELYTVKRWAKSGVVEEGDPEKLFDSPAAPTLAPNENVPPLNSNENEERGDAIPAAVFNLGQGTAPSNEDIAYVRGLGFDVDDDNMPAPENIPEPNVPRPTDYGQTWGWDGIDHRKKGDYFDHQPRLAHGLDDEADLSSHRAYLRLFFTFFPKRYLEETILVQINEEIEKESERKVTFGELLRFIGVWFFLATIAGHPRRDFWSSFPINPRSGAPYRVNEYMSRRRFEIIIKCLSYTDKKPPAFKDAFWEVRDMIQAWNENMDTKFKSGYINCLDESMSTWYNRWTCPGWMFVPRKPRPFGNEYHTICCGLSGVLFRMKIVEGKDAPPQLNTTPSKKKTAELMKELCTAILHTGKILVLDSGFCVLEALVELKKAGVFAHAVIKKRRYWPKYILGGLIDNYFSNKNIGEVDCLKGVLDEEPYNIFCMKESEYVMKLMATYGCLTEARYDPGEALEDRVNNQVEQISFKYCQPFKDHFQYRHMVDDHNHLRHSNPSLEDTWSTHRWANRVFAFLIAVTEVNVYLWLRYKVWSKGPKDKEPSLHQFRKDFSFALIENPHYVRDEEESRVPTTRSGSETQHKLRDAPWHAREYKNGKWDKTCKTRCSQHKCKTVGCKRRFRTYCSCNVGFWMCRDCYCKHAIEAPSSDSTWN